MATQPQDADLFEPADPDFFDRHKNSIIGGIIAVVVLIILAGVIQVTRQNRFAAAAVEFSTAETTEALRAIADAKNNVFAANARLALSGRYRAEGKYDEAVSILDGFAKKFPKHQLLPQASLSLAATLEAQGKLAEAAEAYRDAYTAHPDTYIAPYAMLAHGRLLRLEGKTDEARGILQSAITRYPGTAPVQEAIQELEQLPAATEEGAE